MSVKVAFFVVAALLVILTNAGRADDLSTDMICHFTSQGKTGAMNPALGDVPVITIPLSKDNTYLPTRYWLYGIPSMAVTNPSVNVDLITFVDHLSGDRKFVRDIELNTKTLKAKLTDTVEYYDQGRRIAYTSLKYKGSCELK